MATCSTLNTGPVPEGIAGLDIAAQLRNRINRLKGEFYDTEKGRVNYAAMRDSPAFREYTDVAAMLTLFDPRQLKTREEKLAFWINLYNVLIIHGVIEMGVQESVKEVPRFFRRFCYRIGEMTFTPDDIEHGILRGNRRPPHGLFRPFASPDPRLTLVIDRPDPRIHFTLVCAGSSCPPINFYSAERIEEELEMAATNFINSPEVEVRPGKGEIRLSPVFKWYLSDFGGRDGLRAILARYLDPGEFRDFVLERGLQARVTWKDYDWQLNN
ncbi:MAG: DUF547 domain-containing protein [Nitrospirota bacterium]|nr:DUF547 domain-containing protein [Nitrospirota bacterium]